METTRRSCVLTYATSLDGTRAVSIPNPRDGLNETTVGMAAMHIADANLFDQTVGSLAELIRAEVVTVTTRTLLPVV